MTLFDSFLLLAMLTVFYALLNSFHVMPGDQMIQRSTLGDPEKRSYIPTSFADKTDEKGRNMLQCGGKKGILDYNVVFALWPIQQILRIPITTITIILHSVRVYTKETAESPSIPINLTVTINIRLKPYVLLLLQTFNLIGKGQNLAMECDIHDNLWNESEAKKQEEAGEKVHHVHRGPLIAKIIMEAIEDLVQEAVKAVVKNQFPWHSTDPNLPDINSAVDELEKAVLLRLSTYESPLQLAGLLKKDSHEVGPCALSFDLNIHDIDPADAATREALGKPMEAILKARAAKSDGEGEGNRLAAIARKIKDEDGQRVLAAEQIKHVDNMTLLGAGENIVDLAKTLIERHKPKP